jgi:hypothetical protein
VLLADNRISIRERNFPDLLDMALHVIRAYAVPLCVALAAGVVPAMLLNAWLLAPLARVNPQYGMPTAYVWWMFLLVLWEAPLVTAPVTLYLGQALFTERPLPGRIVRNFFASLPQMIWYQVVVRAFTIGLIITWLFQFISWAYLSEVILLERNRFWRGRRNAMTTSRRTLILHKGTGNDLFARWITTVAVGVMLLLSIWYSMIVLRGVLVADLSWDWWEMSLYTFHYPLALWLVVGYLTVVRFLAYLDLRIRREGWEVELMMRSEAARLTRQLT